MRPDLNRDPLKPVEILIRLILAAVYLYAAAGKIVDPLAFARAVFNYRLFPDATVVPIALVVPIWEALIGLGLLTAVAYRGSALSTALLSLGFAFAVGSAVVRGIDLNCGCFGAGVSSRADWLHVAMNLVSAAAAFWLFWRARRRSPGPIWRFGRGKRAATGDGAATA